jgi:phage protein Gp37/Gp68/IPT/TIG domain-containing protein
MTTFWLGNDLGSEELDIRRWLAEGLEWVIAGGESGPRARPMNLDWARSLRDQCLAMGRPSRTSDGGSLPNLALPACGPTSVSQGALWVAFTPSDRHCLECGLGEPQGVRRFWYIVLGSDDRVSTSKVQLALWTLALSYALLVIVFHDFAYPPGELDPRYLLLLGFPAGAAVGAMAITTGQMASGAVSKKRSPSPKKRVSTAISEIVANDQGDLDLGDAQYFIFNLVALAAFFAAFAHDPVKLPMLPDTLVGLTSASAAAYVAKKAASPALPKITAVSPQKGAVNTPVTIFGSSLAGEGKPHVTLGGLTAVVQSWTDTEIHVTVPAALVPGMLGVQVVTSDGRAAKLPGAFDVVAQSQAPPSGIRYELPPAPNTGSSPTSSSRPCRCS